MGVGSIINTSFSHIHLDKAAIRAGTIVDASRVNTPPPVCLLAKIFLLLKRDDVGFEIRRIFFSDPFNLVLIFRNLPLSNPYVFNTRF